MPSRRPVVRGFATLTALLLALTGVVGHGILFGQAPAALAACDTNLTLSPGGAGINNTIHLGDGLKGGVYSPETLTVTGGNGTNYFWQLTGGSLPPGIIRESVSGSPAGHDDSTEVLSGTPTQYGHYSANIAVYDWPNYPAALNCLPGDSENYVIDVHANGHVTIKLDLIPDSGVDFPFGGDLGPFVLDDNPADAPPNQLTFLALPDTYVITQGDPPNSGYSLKAINCTRGQIYDLPNRKLTLTTIEEDNITCTFVNVFRRPDLQIAKSLLGPFKGDNIYSTRPLPTQTQSRLHVRRGTYSYFVRVQNDGPLGEQDNFRVKGSAQGPSTFGVKYYVNSVDRTSIINQGLWETGDLPRGFYVDIEVRVTVKPGAVVGTKKTVLVSAGSVNKLSQVDLVRAVTSR